MRSQARPGQRGGRRSSSRGPQPSSEDLRTERRALGPKQRACALESPGAQFAYTLRARECVEVERPKVNGREIADVELEIGFVVGALDRCAHAIATLVPRAKCVAHTENDGLVGGVAAAAQGGFDVDEPQPQALEKPESQA